MNNRAYDIISRIVDLHMSQRSSRRLAEDVGEWLVGGEWGKEKDAALGEVWEKTVFEDTEGAGHGSMMRIHRRVMKRIGHRTLYAPARKRRSIALRVAAVVVPLAVLAGTAVWLDRPLPMPSITPEITVMAEMVEDVTLADSSQVWINSGGEIGYNRDFEGDRILQLEGEAFFSVKKDGGKPFRVLAGDVMITVTGTEFSVEAADGCTRIRLYSGEVKVRTPHSRKEITLAPGTELVYDEAEGSIERSEFEIVEGQRPEWMAEVMVVMEYESFGNILRALEKRYRVEITNTAQKPEDGTYTMMFGEGQSLEQVLDALGAVSGGFEYKTDGKQITIY